jgi:hypothetical protein
MLKKFFMQLTTFEENCRNYLEKFILNRNLIGLEQF